MRKNNQGFIQIILILVVIVFVVGGMYYFGTLKNKSEVAVETPTSIPASSETSVKLDTANWKTYINNEYGFSFKYPINWKPAKTDMGSYLIVNEDSHNISIDFMNRFDAKSPLDKWSENKIIEVQNDKNRTGNMIFNLVKNDNRIILGQKPVVIFSGIGDQTVTSYFVETTNKEILTIDVNNNYFDGILQFNKNISSAKADMEIDQILSTFKFTK